MHPVEPLSVPRADATPVSALLCVPDTARVLYVFAHGAGAGMAHPFMASIADGLADRGIASLRYQFPYMERGSRRPDAPDVAQATVRAAVATAASVRPDLPLFAGGKSFGGRMTSRAAAAAPLDAALDRLAGLVFFGFPLHPEGKPSIARADHLADVDRPMLFLQGTRDGLADVSLLEPVVAALGSRATLRLFADADHSFHVRKGSGTNDERVRDALLDATAEWMDRVIA